MAMPVQPASAAPDCHNRGRACGCAVALTPAWAAAREGGPARSGFMTDTPRSFQEIILRLMAYWGRQGCAVLQPYDMEVGAGTFHPATTLR